MFVGLYRIADVNVEIRSLYRRVQDMCQDYKTTQEPELMISITEEAIASEAKLAQQNMQNEGLKVVCFSNDYYETLAVYRQLSTQLLSRNVFLFHGSVVAVDGLAYLFTAKSGTGKSTHVALWRKLFGGRAVMVNDDKPLIRVSADGVFVYGTPWNGKHHLGNNMVAPLKAICILSRGQQNAIAGISATEACPLLLKQTFMPELPLDVAKTLQLVNEMTKKVAFYHLHCNMDDEAALVSYNGMK